jgi:hypothetical protein
LSLTDPQEQALKMVVYDSVQADMGSFPEAHEGLLLQEFVVVASLTGFDEQGNRITQVAIIPIDGPNHRIMGLLEEAKIRFEADMLDDYLEKD